MHKNIALLAGDGIGPEIMNEAVKVLDAIAKKFTHTFTYSEALVGGAAYEKHQEHLPATTIEICENADAILFGSVGGPVDQIHEPKWNNCEKISLLGLRKHFQLGVNLRPVALHPSLSHLSVLRSDLAESGVDILCVRELVGGIYFGTHETFEQNGVRMARDVMEYDENIIRTAARFAFAAAQKRRGNLISVDKANVLDCSKLWRKVVDEVAPEFPDVRYSHMLVDNAAMQLVQWPAQFDVLFTSNMFGDILSDLMSTLGGSIGMLPSASLNAEGFGMYEPSGGSAQDIAGKGLANPIGQILSAAMMLKYSFGMHTEHDAIVNAVDGCLREGILTGDLDRKNSVSTSVFGDAVVERI